MNKKLLVFLCTINFLSYAAEKPEGSINAFDWFSMQNEKKTNEDSLVIWYRPQRGYLSGVFDGHAGSEVASYVEKNVHLKFYEYLDQAFTVKQSFEHAFADIEEYVVNKFKSGSTAALVYISDDNGIAHVANIGDSRAVFGNKNVVTFATQDQTLQREDERERVLKAGGIIFREKSITSGAVGPWRINGLATSRTLGDAWAKGRDLSITRGIGGTREVILDGKPAVMISEQWPDICFKERQICKPQVGQLIAEPEYTEHQLTDTDRWLIIASDGLWDVVNNEEALTIVQDYYDKEGCLRGIAYFLCKYAITRHSTDNITVIVVDLLSNLFKKKI